MAFINVVVGFAVVAMYMPYLGLTELIKYADRVVRGTGDPDKAVLPADE